MLALEINLGEKCVDGLRPITDDYESGSVYFKDNWCLIEVVKALAGSCYSERVLCQIVHITAKIPHEKTRECLQQLVLAGVVQKISRNGEPGGYTFKAGAYLNFQIGVPPT